MNIDYARRHIFARAIHDLVAFGGRIATADGNNLAIAKQHDAIVYAPACSVINSRADEGRRSAGIRPVGRREGDVAVLSQKRAALDFG